jgi:ubiquinone/menaquinone biosynthesis C-methylase UbiE
MLPVRRESTLLSLPRQPPIDLATRTSAARLPNKRRPLLSKIDRALEDVDLLVPLDDDRFHKTHEAFEARSNQRERILAWLCEHSGKITTRSGDLRVLSIGCGDGSVDLPTARTLGDKADHIHFAALDPNKAQLTQLEKAFADAALSNVTLTTHAMQLGDFDAKERFDHIHCVHSFYYMPDPATALKQAIEMLADDGELLLFHAPCEDLNSLSARFYNKYFERATPFAEDFATLLDGEGHSYRRERIDARIDVTSLFDTLPTHGHELRDFILQFDSSSLPSAVVDPVERYIRVIAEGTRSAASIAHPVDVFVIRRRTIGTR